MRTSVILPTYNEKHNIIKLLKEILKYLPQASECIVVDDNSPDGTGKLVNSHFSTNPRVRCFIRKKERGLGTAILFGLTKSRGEILLIMDSDFNHQPKYIPKFLNYSKKYDIVCGSRYVKGGDMPETPLRFLGSYLFNIFIRLLLRVQVKDSLSGFVSFTKSTFNLLSLQEKKEIFCGFGDWYIRWLWWAHKRNLEIKEFPVKYGSRLGDVSKMNFLQSIIDYSKVVLELKIRSVS